MNCHCHCYHANRNPVVCGITSLGYDHVDILGDTLEKIAWQKGGICKPGHPAFTLPQDPVPLRALEERAKDLKVCVLLIFRATVYSCSVFQGLVVCCSAGGII